MSIWAISDLHLCFTSPSKNMEEFGEIWQDYTQKIKKNWENNISSQDLILITGDISWATHLKDAVYDLQWIDNLPGTKLIIKGNHDFWWPSKKKLKAVLPPSLHILQNNAFNWQGVTIGGARLWDSSEFSFEEYIELKDNQHAFPNALSPQQNEKIFQRELHRLHLSLSQMDKDASIRIAMTHFPPIGGNLKNSKASLILEKYKVDTVVFGHLHSLKKGVKIFGEKKGIHYILVSADYINFTPLKIYSQESIQIQ